MPENIIFSIHLKDDSKCFLCGEGVGTASNKAMS